MQEGIPAELNTSGDETQRQPIAGLVQIRTILSCARNRREAVRLRRFRAL
jgi:hypothetical protein